MRVMRGLGNMPYSGRLKQHGLVSLSMGREGVKLIVV